MPSISHSSSPSVVPRRSAAASMTTSVSALAVDPPPHPPEPPPWPPSPPDPPKMSIRASIRWASSDSPAAAPAAFQRALASAFRALGPPGPRRSRRQKNSPRMPPFSSWCQRKYRWVCTRARRARSVSRLRLAARIRAAVSESSCCEAPCPMRSNKDSVASGTSVAVLTTTPSWSGESSDSWSASVSRGSAAARSAAARRPLALAAEVPESEPSQSWAEPWPSLANEPVSTTRGVNSATPEAAARSISAKEATMLRAWSPETEWGSASRTSCWNSSKTVSSLSPNAVPNPSRRIPSRRMPSPRIPSRRIPSRHDRVVLVQRLHVVGEWPVVGGCHERR